MTRSLNEIGRSIAVIVTVLWLASCSREPSSEPPSPVAGETFAEHALKHARGSYRCPMHPEVVRDEPGVCPICGMDLVEVRDEAEAVSTTGSEPVYYRHPHDPARTSPVPAKDEMGMDYVPVFAGEGGPEIRISPAVVNNLGVRTEAVEMRPVPQRVQTVGYVDYDERRVSQVRPRAEGWIEGLAVRSAGDTVDAGQLLFHVYSPVMESAQQEYLDALSIGNGDLVEASRERLRALGIDAGTTRRLASRGRASGRVPFTAPVAGVVTELAVEEGAMVTPDMTVMTITELDSLWIIAEVPESRSSWVRPGTTAELTFPSLPGKRVDSEVDYVYPELNARTRTVRARITLKSPLTGIRPGMLANVSLIGNGGQAALSIPRNAVIRGAEQDHVVLALGEGRFAPRPVVVGPENGDRLAVLEGLAAGDRVVVAGQFLLDSEANLNAALQRMKNEPDAPVSRPSAGEAADPSQDAHQH